METLKQIGAPLGVDETILYSFALVCVVYFFVANLYLKPFQKLLHKRKEKTEGAKKEAAELVARAEEKLATYKERLSAANEKARGAMNEKIEAGKKEEAKLLAEASHKAKVSLQSAQKELETQRKQVVDSLAAEVSGLAGEIAAKVMGRSVSPR